MVIGLADLFNKSTITDNWTTQSPISSNININSSPSEDLRKDKKLVNSFKTLVFQTSLSFLWSLY